MCGAVLALQSRGRCAHDLAHPANMLLLLLYRLGRTVQAAAIPLWIHQQAELV